MFILSKRILGKKRLSRSVLVLRVLSVFFPVNQMKISIILHSDYIN